MEFSPWSKLFQRTKPIVHPALHREVALLAAGGDRLEQVEHLALGYGWSPVDEKLPSGAIRYESPRGGKLDIYPPEANGSGHGWEVQIWVRELGQSGDELREAAGELRFARSFPTARIDKDPETRWTTYIERLLTPYLMRA